MSWIKRLISGLYKRLPHKVIIHFPDGDWETIAKNRIIRVPWMASWHTVAMRLEDDGTVTIADKYFAGYGKQYGNTTWEKSK